jgi:hypothetical protein
MIKAILGGRQQGRTRWLKIQSVLNPSIRLMTAEQIASLRVNPVPTPGHDSAGDWVRKRFFRENTDGPTWTVVQVDWPTA